MKNGAVNKYKRINARKWEIEHEIYIYNIIYYLVRIIIYIYMMLANLGLFINKLQKTASSGVNPSIAGMTDITFLRQLTITRHSI